MISSTIDAPSHSRLASIHFCERKYFYKYARQLESPEQFAPAFMGQAMHAGLEAYHRSGDSNIAITALETAWGTRRFFGDYDWVTPGHAGIVLRAYMDSKHTQDWTVLKLCRSDLNAACLIESDVQEDGAGYLMLAEASFVVDVPGLGLVNVRPDLLLQVPTGIRVVDHKTTTSYLGSNVYNTTKYTHQLRLYALAMGALLGQPVGEGGCNAIYTGKSASSPSFKGNRWEMYTFDYSPADFEETKAWYRVGKRKMEHVAEHFTDADELSAPQNPGSHCGYCEYSKLCSAPAALRSGLVKMNYRKKEAA
jgi:hypothetical protein